ncbi:MAG: gliding motility-associated C-terminal domain-containing protein, partial [Hymenobacter sp.]
QVTITVNPAAAASVGTATRATCSGSPITLGAAAVTGSTYSWSPSTGLSSSTAANPTVTLTNTTGAPITQTYTLTETTSAGCSATNSVTVTINPAIVAAPGPAVTICSGASAQLGGPAVAGLTYSWSPATGLSSSTVANPTVTLTNTTSIATTQTYTLTTTNATTGCVGTATVVVTVNPAVVATAGAAVAICQGGTAQLGAAPVAGYTYSWSPATGLSSPTVANPTVTLTNPVNTTTTYTYTLTVTSTATGCTNTASVVVTVNFRPVAVAGPAVTICSGGSAMLGTVPDVGGMTYSWSPSTGLNSPTSPSPTVTLTNTTGAPTTQTYTLTVTSTATGCTNTASVVVTVNPLPTVVPGTAVAICSGASTTLGGPAVTGLTYSWSPATGLSSPTVANPTVTLTNTSSAATTQTYTLTATNTVTGCANTGTVVVTVNPLPVVAPGAAVAICSGTSATLGAAPVAGYTYSWSPATGLSSTTIANPTVTLTNTTSAVTTQTYTLTTTNTATGCVNTGTVVVTVNPAAIANAGAAQALCADQTVTLGTPALAGYTYQWTPAANLSSATAAQPVLTGVNTTAAPLVLSYSVLATTAQGCTATSTVQITVNPRPATDSIAGAQSVCPTITGIAYSIRNPHSPSYQWTVTGGAIASGQGTAAITVNWGTAGTGSVSAYATNAQGCNSNVYALPVRINQVLQTVKPSGPASVCQADGPYAYSTQAVNGSSFAWQLFGTAAGTLVSTGNTTSISFTSVGLAKLVVTQTSNPAGGVCRGVSDTLYITVKPSPSTALTIQGPARFCFNSGPQTYTLPGATGSTYVFQLNGTTIANVGGTATIPATTAVGTYTLTARETNSGGCAGVLYSKTFIVDPRPGVLTINGPRFVCPATRTLTYTVPNATSTSTYQWTVTGGTIASGQGTATITVTFPATLTANATVSVSETSQFGCGGTAVSATVVPDNAQAPQLTLASVVATDNGKVTLTFSVANPANTPGQVQVLRREAGSTGAYAPVGTVAPGATSFTDATPNAAQTAYQYTLSLTNGCGDVLAGPTPHTTTLLKAVAVPGAPNTPRSQGGSSLSWTAYQGFTVTSYQVYQQLDNGGYTLLGTVSGNTLTYNVPNTGQGFAQCYRVVAASSDAQPRLANSNTACVEFTNSLAFYNVITPNNDGQNDKLEILNVQLYPGNTMEIYNRWGRQVFATTNYNNDSNYWGTDPGIAPGVYYYLFKQANGSATKGWVEVVK